METDYSMSDESLASSWRVTLRTAKNATVTERPVRKYLWVRRTSRRAYNQHMHKMRETLVDIQAAPAVVIFTSIIGIALCLSLFIH